ncbi:Phospholipase D family, partial [Corchorus capsularis]
VSCGNRSINLGVTGNGKAKEWVAAAINDAPQRGLNEDGSQAQWFIDGKSAFASIEKANSETFITGWWLCPELYMRRP